MAVPMDLFAPYDAGAGSDTTEDGWRAIMQHLARPGVVRDILNSLEVYADTTGMQVKVKTGVAWAQGQYGQVSTEKIVPVPNNTTLANRLDRVVWRNNFSTNKFELDIIVGTVNGVLPDLTRNSSIYEGSLAYINVPQNDTTIDASQITDARSWGGGLTPTVADDYEIFGDKASTTARSSINNIVTSVTGVTYVNLFKVQRDCVATKFRHYLAQAQVGGTTACKIYAGNSPRYLTDVTGAATINIDLTTNANSMHEVALSPTITLQAGQWVALGYVSSGFSTAPQWGTNGLFAATFTPSATILNPSTLPSIAQSAQKTLGTLPSFIDTKDGSWTGRTYVTWAALA